MSWEIRTELLLGEEKIEKLHKAHVLVAGLGGVGSYACESLARAGIGRFTIMDGDVVSPSNINRQLLALHQTIAESKCELMKNRILQINPTAEISMINTYMKADQMELLFHEKYDYILDAIDTLLPKVNLICHSIKSGVKIVSSMGCGAKNNPSKIQIKDISESYNCRLADYVRKHLHKFGIRKGFWVVFSPENIIKDAVLVTDHELNKKTTVGTISYMPAIFGLFCASVVVREVAGIEVV